MSVTMSTVVSIKKMQHLVIWEIGIGGGEKQCNNGDMKPFTT